MASASNDFVTADLRGMKAALSARARATGLGLSSLVRSAVAKELDLHGASESRAPLANTATGRAIQIATAPKWTASSSIVSAGYRATAG